MDGDRGAGREKGLRIGLLIKMMADMHKLSAVILAVGLVLTACQNQSPDSTGADTSEKVSVATRTDMPVFSDQIVGQDRNGRDLKVPQFDSSFIKMKDSLLQEAEASLKMSGGDAAMRTDIGRRNLELGRYEDALEIFSEGIKQDPNSLADYRYRGASYYQLQQFENALADFQQAKQLAKEQPNQIEYQVDGTAANTPVYNLHFSTYYYLGLLYFEDGRYDEAVRHFGYAWNNAANNDLKSMLSFWLVLSFKKQKMEGQASSVMREISPEMTMIGSPVYRDLCVMFSGYMSTDELLQKYTDASHEEYLVSRFGVGMWYAFDGQGDRARTLLESAVGTGYWLSDAYPVAQSELARM